MLTTMYSVTQCSEPIQCIAYMVPADPPDAQQITILGNDTVYQRNTVPADPLGTCKVVESPKKSKRVGEIWMVSEDTPLVPLYALQSSIWYSSVRRLTPLGPPYSICRSPAPPDTFHMCLHPPRVRPAW